MSERRAAYRTPPSREWRWECDEQMYRAQEAMRRDLHPGAGKRQRIVPLRLTERAVDDSGVPRMSGELLAYLDAPEAAESQRWRALYQWSPAHADLYWAYLRVRFAGGARREVTEEEMEKLAAAFDRSAATIRRHLAACRQYLHVFVYERLMGDVARNQEESNVHLDQGEADAGGALLVS